MHICDIQQERACANACACVCVRVYTLEMGCVCARIGVYARVCGWMFVRKPVSLSVRDCARAHSVHIDGIPSTVSYYRP